MKELIEKDLKIALKAYLSSRETTLDPLPEFELDYTKDSKHGDFASNIAMVLAKPLGRSPRSIAEGILDFFPDVNYLDKAEVAGPGFINISITKQAFLQLIPEIISEGVNYGKSSFGKNTKILLEFVSSNPTGPIHIGHGRGAAYGSVLAELLLTTGHDVTREYYVNDAGRQMDILTISVWLRYLKLMTQEDIPFPANAYHGEYISDIAKMFFTVQKKLPLPDLNELHSIVNGHTDEDIKLDRVISLMKLTLIDNQYGEILDFTLKEILAEIKEDLEDFGVMFDNWFSERYLINNREIDHCISQLKTSGDLYEKEGAIWFKSTRYGDEKDRVVTRENGQATYFASDIAYHVNKYQRGFDQVINIWGADHHGYISRVKGAIQAMGYDAEKLKILLVQFATLFKDNKKIQMSTRSGEYVTLKQLRDEVGNNAARFFYVMRKSEQHLDFDLDLAKTESNANPVYYIQYAHARICSVFKQMKEKGYTLDTGMGNSNLNKLDTQHESELVKSLSRYKEVVLDAAINYEPHLLSFYLRELANDFHAYYNSYQFLVDDAELRAARLCLISATRQVIKNGLDLLGVSAPEEM
jgi:arginyl-tRNA synthetase